MDQIYFTDWRQHCLPGWFHQSVYYIKRLFWTASLRDIQLKTMSDIIEKLLAPTFDFSKVYEVDTFPVGTHDGLGPCYDTVILFKTDNDIVKFEVRVNRYGHVTIYFRSHKKDVAITDIAIDYDMFERIFRSRICSTIRKHDINILKQERTDVQQTCSENKDNLQESICSPGT